jgi:hypothetical protein
MRKTIAAGYSIRPKRIHLQVPMRSIALLLCCTFAGSSALPAPRSRHETITGRVVAYTTRFPSCLNGNGYWEMVIPVRQSKHIESEFVRAHFSLPCGATPDWVSAKPLERKFRLERKKDCVAVLERFVHTESKQDPTVPLWKHPQGAEQDRLPFSQITPCYHSVDMPPAPVL